jgi:hypothetical protein
LSQPHKCSYEDNQAKNVKRADKSMSKVATFMLDNCAIPTIENLIYSVGPKNVTIEAAVCPLNEPIVAFRSMHFIQNFKRFHLIVKPAFADFLDAYVVPLIQRH